MIHKNDSIRKIGQMPWGYTEGFFVALAILFAGSVLETIRPLKTNTFAYPVNIFVGLFIVTLIVISYNQIRKWKFVAWLASVPGSISAIGLFGVLTLSMAFIPQSPNAGSGFIHHLVSTWLYVLAVFFMLWSLGVVTLRRILRIRRKSDLGFVSAHLGLWIILFAGTMGAPDVLQFRMQLKLNEPTKYGFDDKYRLYDMPFKVTLNDFTMEEFRPQISMVDITTGSVVTYNGKPATFEISDTSVTKLMGFEVRLKTFYPMAYRDSFAYHASTDTLSVPAALIEVSHNGETRTGWMSSGNSTRNPEVFRLNQSIVLAMHLPEAKTFKSNITIQASDGSTKNGVVNVNAPIDFEGWKIYQTGYDENLGRWSQYSVIELIRDPWLPVVYTGCFLLIGGAFYMIFSKKKTQVPDEEPAA